MSKVALSKEQAEIVTHNDGEGAMLVEASAGSGKTRILTERVRYLLTEKKDKFFSVLCLTFTNKAADEMKDRLTSIHKVSERTFIGTFHEFCLNIIKIRFTELGFSRQPHLFDENDTKKLLEEVLIKNPILKDLYSFPDCPDLNEKAKKQRELFFKCQDFISDAKRKLIYISDIESDYKNWGEKNTLLFQDYNRRLREQNAMDFDDILLFAYKIVSERPAIANIYRRTYKYILIDEAQDLNFAQYNVIKAICGENHKNVLMVGDPKQAIYGFNGASPVFMQEDFKRDFEAERKEIKHNYRSSQSVLEVAEKIQPNGGVGNNFFKGEKGIYHFENETLEAAWVIDKIKYWIEKGKYSEPDNEIEEPISYKNIAILARNKYVFSALIELLGQDEILKNKFYLKKGIERFEADSIFVRLFDLGLRILVNPKDIIHYNEIQELLKINITYSDQRINELFDLANNDCEVLTKEQINLLITYWKHLLDNPKSLGWVLDKLEQDVSQFNQETEETKNEFERIVFDIKELKQFWNSFVRNESADNLTISNFRYFLALNGSKENREELTLATVHTTKGLEYEIVFIMGMNEGVFPDYRAKTEAAKKEERNNAYVAVTRAKRVLYITYPLCKKMSWGDSKQNISGFLLNFINQV